MHTARSLLIALLLMAPATAFAQTWNANAGGYNTGFGTVYGSFGLAMATQNMYQSMQQSVYRSMMRDSMARQHGQPAVAEPARNLGAFVPDPTLDTGSQLAEALGSTDDEKALIAAVYEQTRSAYAEEITAQGWGNTIASGLTFFTVTALVVYHDVEEPSEDAVDAFHALMVQSLDAMPEVAEVSDADKQGFDNLMVGFAGLLLVGYTQGKETQDAETLAAYRELAGQLIQLVLKVEPAKLRLENGRIVVG